MSSPSVITLRVSKELKERLAGLAEKQGVSMNQLLTYFLTEKATQMEMHERIQERFERIQNRSIEELRQAALTVLDQQRVLLSEEISEHDRFPRQKKVSYDDLPARPVFSLNEEDATYRVDQDDSDG